MRHLAGLVVAATFCLAAQPALAGQQVPLPPLPEAGAGATPPSPYYFDPAARDAWLADCRQRLSKRDSGLGGAAIGGVVGGLAGNRIAGKGNRTVGTIAGAAIGAVAGAVIDKAEDAGRNRDECEAYLDDYLARYGQAGYPGHGFGYGQGYGYAHAGYGYAAGGCCMMGQPMMMVPVMQAKPQCTETVEYVYEDVPVRPRPVKRYVPKPKPTKIVPDKRIKTSPDKRISVK